MAISVALGTSQDYFQKSFTIYIQHILIYTIYIQRCLNVLILASLLTLGVIEIIFANLVKVKDVAFLLPRNHNLKGLLMVL